MNIRKPVGWHSNIDIPSLYTSIDRKEKVLKFLDLFQTE